MVWKTDSWAYFHRIIPIPLGCLSGEVCGNDKCIYVKVTRRRRKWVLKMEVETIIRVL